MNVSVTEDNKFLILRDLTKLELDQLRLTFSKEPSDVTWAVKKKMPWAVKKHEFFNKYGMLPIGLWTELLKVCQKYGFSLNFDSRVNDVIQDSRLQFDTFKYYCDTLFENAVSGSGDKIEPMGYQLEGVFKLIKFKKACVEVTTSGGKTMMAYILFKFLRDVQHVKKCLYIVPNTNLANQSHEKFDIYEEWVKGDHSWKSAKLIGGLTKKERDLIPGCDILFATYQSLNNRPDDFFKDFDMVLVDEAHHSIATSIKKIISKCIGVRYCFGVTGTFPKEDTFERYTIETFIGPLVYILTAFQLINKENFATPIYIINEILDYASNEEKEALYQSRKLKDREDMNSGSRLLKQEQTYVNSNYNRLKYIAELAIKTKHNTLILFNDIKGGYGKKIFDYLKENCDKNVYYADGDTSTDARDFYKKKMEEDTTGQTVIVGSIGCFSEGIDVANLWTIILAQSVKSMFIVRQMIGRGMRMYKGKDKVVIFDIVDDLRFGNNGDPAWLKHNYMWKHHLERNKIYKEHKFPVFDRKVPFTKLNTF